MATTKTKTTVLSKPKKTQLSAPSSAKASARTAGAAEGADTPTPKAVAAAARTSKAK